MTDNESIEILEERYLTMSMCGDIEQCKKNNQAISEAITALKEIHQYRAIGTVEECRVARERQRGKKPIRIAPCKSVNYFKCSSCGNFLSIDKPFCEECGSAVDWSE